MQYLYAKRIGWHPREHLRHSVLGMIEWALAVIYKFSGGEKEEGRLLNADIKLAIALLANEIFRGESY